MDDESLMQHLETDHAGDLRIPFVAEPGRANRRLQDLSTWLAYHDTLHRLYPTKYQHDHSGATMEKVTPDLKFEEHKEPIWVLTRVGDGDAVADAFISEEAARKAEEKGDYAWGVEAVQVMLHRPSLAPIYGGPTLLEALWNEMDRLMEGLMTGTAAEDGGDKYRAQSIAWVIAISTNPYAPSIDRVRAEAMERWNEAQAE